MTRDLTTDTKYSRVVNMIRDRIVSGDYKPGDRLPTRSEIMRKFGLGTATVQKALDSLIEDGFVYTKARRGGTFVSDNPPHLCEFAFVIPASGRWSKWYMALREASDMIMGQSDVRFKEYCVSREVGERGDVIRLCRDAVHHRLGGVIFGGLASDLADTPTLLNVDIPCVLFQPVEGLKYPVLQVDGESFRDRAVEYLASKGRRRIAHLFLDYAWSSVDEFMAIARKCTPDVREYWIQPVRVGEKLHGTKQVANLLMQLEGDKRPDGLIIHDDNLVEEAVAGLISAGVKAPDDIEVVAHANFPSRLQLGMSVKRLGFDARVLLRKALDLLAMQRRKEAVPGKVLISSCFEEEIA